MAKHSDVLGGKYIYIYIYAYMWHHNSPQQEEMGLGVCSPGKVLSF